MLLYFGLFKNQEFRTAGSGGTSTESAALSAFKALDENEFNVGVQALL
ncbi:MULTISPECIES: hypothetical protein [Acidiphilium]|nr:MULTISPECIES: hypothetical protein [Acidiphilium]